VTAEAAEKEPIGAVSRRLATGAFTQEIEARGHRLIADEPDELGGEDDGPTPHELLAASLASCISITVDMYARRKGWPLTSIEVEARLAQSGRDKPTHFEIVLTLPNDLSEEQRERLRVIAAKCPVHRILEGEVSFEERVELAATAGS
jgi:putative redox protein